MTEADIIGRRNYEEIPVEVTVAFDEFMMVTYVIAAFGLSSSDLSVEFNGPTLQDDLTKLDP